MCATWRRERGPLLFGAVAGAGLTYLFDPHRGRQRRRFARQRVAGAVRHVARHLARGVRAGVLQTFGEAKGVLYRLRPPRAMETLDDVALAHKVESVLFRDPAVPKGRISINAENGAVFVRGQLDSAELIEGIAGAVRKIADVAEVVNLLHLPGTDAPHPPAERGAMRTRAPA
jgi:osmotically-inducible protein OsmY